METVLLGYFPRYTPRRPSWLRALVVEEICCAVTHICDPLRLEHIPHQNRQNAARLFDSEEIAWAALRDEILIRLTPDASNEPPWRVELQRPAAEKFDLYAFKVLPLQFLNEQRQDFAPPASAVKPLPEDYERLGYDAAGWNGHQPFECSPLICNCEAIEQDTNRFCLFDEIEPAMELACRYSGSNWKEIWPNSGHCGVGPQCVVEIWRKRRPFAEPPRIGPAFEWPADLLSRLVQHKIAHGRVFER